jgi:S1-C subfamily serine protease
MIHLQCPSCKQNLEVADYLAGLPVVCKSCSASVPVPSGKAKPEDVTQSGSQLAKRLAFLQNVPAPKPPAPAPEKPPLPLPTKWSNDWPDSLRAKGWLLAGAGIMIIAVVGALIVVLNQENSTKPDNQVVQNKPSKPELVAKNGKGRKEPDEFFARADSLPNGPDKKKLSPTSLTPNEVYQRLAQATVWVFDRQDFAGSEWVGQEDKPGLGALRFVFLSPTRVVMGPAKGTSLLRIGTWKKDENDIRLQFFDGQRKYSGTIDGRTMKGTAEEGGVTWTWNVARGGKGIGSGVLVDNKNRLLLTNVHVVGDSPAVTVYFPEFADGEVLAGRDYYHKKPGIAGKVVLRAEPFDLALVQLDEVPEGVQAVPLAGKSASAGQSVYSVGNPGESGALWNSSRGQVRQVFHHKWKVTDDLTKHQMQYDAWILETDSPINPGDSGGPLANDQANLVGITHAMHRTAKNISVFIDVRECRKVLAQYYQSIGE